MELEIIDAPVFPEGMLAPLLDLCDTLHRFDRRLYEFAVVTDRDVSPLFEFEGRVLQRSMVGTGSDARANTKKYAQ